MTRWFRLGLSVSGSFVRRCLTSLAMLRFHTPLIEPDVPFSGIRLSDKKTSRFRPRSIPRSVAQADEPQRFVQVLVRVSCGTLSCPLVLPPKPLTEPLPRMAVNGSIRVTDRAEAKVA